MSSPGDPRHGGGSSVAGQFHHVESNVRALFRVASLGGYQARRVTLFLSSAKESHR